MRFFQILIALFCLIFCMPSYADETPAKPAYEPGKTRVAMLPLVNKAADFSASFQAKIKTQAEKAIGDRFLTRGFPFVATKSVDDCLAEMKFDPTDRENWRPDKLIAIGKKLDARIVMLCVITDSHSGDNIGWAFSDIFGGSKEGFASVRVYLVDAEIGKPVLKGETKQGKSSSGALGNFDKGTDRQVRAVVLGFDKALKDFLSDYPAAGKPK